VENCAEQLRRIEATGSGILAVYKPVGWTSFDVVRRVRGVLKIKKLGHAGTLDPFAEGLLLLCAGKETKSVPRLMELTKRYCGVMELGVVTDTYDITGQVKRTRAVENVTKEHILSATTQFCGEIEQMPPMYSAVKVRGKRLYTLARQNKEIERKPRKAVVHSFLIEKFESPLVTFTVTCSKGTYVRTLAHDVGSKLGCGAYLKMLTRTMVGDYSIENALHLSDLKRLTMTEKKSTTLQNADI
jgi:tRNA pseudouridine55 synthase